LRLRLLASAAATCRGYRK
jgi:hypothetical protein